MLKHRLKHLIGATLLTTLALTSCAQPPLPASIPKSEHNAAGDLIPYSGIENKRASAWRNAEVVDDTNIRIRFGTGPAPDCFKYDAEVVETPETITITLFSGWIPNSDSLCPDRILDASNHIEKIAVETKEPINGRTIIDGKTPLEEKKPYKWDGEPHNQVKSNK